MLLRFTLLLAILTAVSGRAQSTSVWKASTNKNWSTNGNWSNGVPNSSTVVAQFTNTSVQPEVVVNAAFEVDRIEFTTGTLAHTFSLKNGSNLTLSGSGIVNGSTATQTFDLKSSSTAAARIAFTNSATAGNAAIIAQGTSSYAGAIDFLNTSSAGSAQLTLEKYGAATFDDTATAATAKITIQDTGSVVTFQGSSTAASANINVSANGSLVFTGNATAGSATIDSTQLDFSGSATAGHAAITTHGPTFFRDSSTAGNATINVTGGGGLTFSGQSSVGNASVVLSNSAGIAFEGNATIGSGTISGVGNLHIKTDGPFVLSGEHTYSGTTQITGSELVVNGALTNTTMVEAFPATTLGGSGTIGGLVAIHPWAQLEPGSDSVGTLTIAGGLLLTSSSIVNFQLGTQSDLIRLTGGTFYYAPGGGNPVTLNLFDSGGFGAGTYILFDFTTGNVELSNIDINNFVLGNTIPGFDYHLVLAGSTLSLTASAIPEPSTYAALFGVGALAFALYRKRRASV